jgi:Fe-S oxidoreductase
LWGEHGKGVRSEFSPRFFGPLYPALQAIKTAFDPKNQFNPGKIAVPGQGTLLRIDGVPMKGQFDRTIPADVRASFDEAMHCNGNAACYNWDPDDAMCPSWKGTRERRHSPKGRAQLMREWLRQLAAQGIDPVAESRRLRANGGWHTFPTRLRNTLSRAPDFSHGVKEAMDGCLACRSCVGQCPIKVDVPAFRSKFLELYHGRYLRPMRDYMVGAIERLLPTMAKLPGLANAMAAGPGAIVTRAIGLTATPQLSGIDIAGEIGRRNVKIAEPVVLRALDVAERTQSVVIVQDAFTSYYETPLLLDLIDLLRALGFRPWLAPFLPNGKPLHVHGMLGAFARVAAKNAAMLRAMEATGIALVGLDPSMTLTYRAEYAALDLPALPRVHLVQEWLAERLADRRDVQPPAVQTSGDYLLLPHCTERTTAQPALRDWQRVFSALNQTLTVVPSGCCGMAGTYGHETEHRGMSEHIYSLSWAHHVAQAGASGRLLADGYSCRSQVKIIDGVRLKHPVQALLAAVNASAARKEPDDVCVLAA